MTEPSNLPRLYDEKEVTSLLKRATSLQQEESYPAVQSGGLSLAELESIAAEAGIDPRYLRRAAAEMASGASEPGTWERVAGERFTLVQEAVVPGELPPEGFERVAAAIQMTAGENGQATLLGRTLTWQAETAGKSRTIQVMVSVRDGETHIRAQERLHQLATGTFVGSTFGVGTGAGIGFGLFALNVFGSALLAFAFPAAAWAFSFMAAREIYGRIVRRRRAALAALVDAVVDAASESISG
ncbi:MAG: hypothetical protein Q8N53_24780 [Longimicrobiales bacterium]|nr:hypothetical protein [Longimicrobiales bacterium]